MAKQVSKPKPISYEEALKHVVSLVFDQFRSVEELIGEPELEYDGRKADYQSIQQEYRGFMQVSSTAIFADTIEERKATLEQLQQRAKTFLKQSLDSKLKMQRKLYEIGAGLISELGSAEEGFYGKIVENGFKHPEDISKLREEREGAGVKIKGTQDDDGLEGVLAMFGSMLRNTSREDLEPYLKRQSRAIARIQGFMDKYRNSGFDLTPFQMILNYVNPILDPFDGPHGKMVMASNLVGPQNQF